MRQQQVSLGNVNSVRERRRLTPLTAIVISLATAIATVAYSPVVPQFYPEQTHTIIAFAAIDALPRPLFDSFSAHRDIIAQEIGTLDARTVIDSRKREQKVWLDYAVPENADTAARLLAARDFPMDPDESKTKGYRSETFGDLPFALQDHVQQLTLALRTAQWELARGHTLQILRLSTFVGFPSQMTRDSNSVDAHNAELRVVVGMRPRLLHEVRVFPGRFLRAVDTSALILAALRESHANYFHILDIVADAQRETGVTHSLGKVYLVKPEAPSVREFRRLYAERAGNLMCEQFKNAALLAANLIGTAWMDAGSPEVPMDTFAPRAENKPGDTAKQDGADKSGVAAGDQKKSAAAGAVDLVADKFMGSSGSETYHRSSCQHAARIKPENTIRFTSLEEAQRAGRKACQTCKPDAK